MAEIKLKIDDLVLDGDNPRITHADSQQQALQKVVRDQKIKLVRLAESIVEHGLSPIERFMVMEVSQKPKRYVALEGNRRVTALKLLANPAAMTGLDMPNGMQRSMEKLAAVFDRTKVEPITAFEVKSRDEGRYWIELKHNGEDEGRGVVAWKPVVAARYRKKEPAIQALDMVLDHGGFDEDESERIRASFSLTTLRRLLDSKDVRAAIGLTVENGQLSTALPGSEIIKPLRKMVRDIADKAVDSRRFNKTEKMLDYVKGFDKASRPDMSRKGSAARPIEGIPKPEFGKAKARSEPKRQSKPDERRSVVPKGCVLNVTDNRIAEIYRELQTLKLAEARNAIAVLLRVFLELSVDHFLEENGGKLKVAKPGGGERHLELDKKLAETVTLLVSMGVPNDHFKAVTRSLSVKTSPMQIDLLHAYVHSRFQTPSPAELTAAWDHAQPLFEKIWP
jgi:hypothetical protein